MQFIAKFITFRVMYNMRKLYFSQDYILFYSGSGKSKFSFVQFQKKKTIIYVIFLDAKVPSQNILGAKRKLS